MIKRFLFAAALLSLALASGCATGGKGPGPAITVKVNGTVAVAYVTQTVTFTATVSNTSNQAVTWSLSGTACTGTPNPCGSIGMNTGVYTAPGTAPNPHTVAIVATSVADTTASGSDTISVAQVTVNVTPATANVGLGLTQQFTAIAVPDDAPQTFAWSAPTCAAPPCGTVVQDTNNPGLAVYTAPANSSSANGVLLTATSTLDPSGIGQASLTVVNSRLGGNSTNPTFAFRFSGYNASGATALVGNFVVGSNGQITNGVADALTLAGPQHYASLTGSYAATSNNQGKITLNLGGGPTYVYTVVLDANGDIGAIESDSNGTGSGVIEQLSKAPSSFNSALLNGGFVFGFTGTDASGKRVGYAGFLPMDGKGDIGTAGGNATPGLMDINDAGTASPQAPDVTGSYSMTNGVGTMSFTSSTLGGVTYNFNLYAAFGLTNSTNPLTIYAISTDAGNPEVSGAIVFQDPKGSPYNVATMNNVSVVSLTGADNGGANVSLTLVNLDGAGNLNGNFDQNDAGTILSVSTFSTGYTYLNSSNGRYTLKLLGNPNASPVVAPLPFILYASGNGRGFLLDQSSTSVITGTMAPQGKGSGTYSASQLPSTFAAATTSSAVSGVSPLAADLLFTWTNPSQGMTGTQYVGMGSPQTTTGTYTLNDTGVGTITLTAPAAQSYVIYTVDSSGCTGQEISCTLQDFFMIDVDKTITNPSVIFARQ